MNHEWMKKELLERQFTTKKRDKPATYKLHCFRDECYIYVIFCTEERTKVKWRFDAKLIGDEEYNFNGDKQHLSIKLVDEILKRWDENGGIPRNSLNKFIAELF